MIQSAAIAATPNYSVGYVIKRLIEVGFTTNNS